ncbi:MAG: Holliday junction resolvase RuvX [Planctomycetota bacterium]
MAKILGIDYGSKRIGLSVSVPLMGMAVGYDVIEMNDSLSNNIKAIVIKEKIESIVIGLPKRMDNTLGQSAQEVMKFSEELKKVLNIPVILWDERLTSKQAEILLRDVNLSHKDKRQQINITSAQLMLQSYMDAQTVNPVRDV